jgi:hypothetical protein
MNFVKIAAYGTTVFKIDHAIRKWLCVNFYF